MMKKTLTVICIILIALGLMIAAYSQFVLLPRQGHTYVISSWTILDIYVTRPLFFVAFPCLLMLRFLKAPVKPRTAKITRWIGLTLLVFYLLEIALFLGGGGVSSMSLILISNLVTAPYQFGILGILIGIGYSGS